MKNNKIQRVVILGANSFIAKSTITHLRKEKVKIIKVSRKQIDFHNKNSVKKLKIIVKQNDIIFLSAAKAPVKNISMLNYNMTIIENIVESLKNINLKQFIYLSSDAVYKDSLKLINENSICEPDSLHGLMHLAREKYLKSIYLDKICIVRPTLVYGLNDPHNGYGPNMFLRKAQKKQNIKLFGKGEEKRDHVHVKDVGLVLYNLIKIKYEGIVNIVTGNAISFLTIALKIKNTYKIKLKYLKRIGPMPHNGYRAFNNKLIKKILPKVEFDNILDWIEKKEKYK